MLGEAYRGQKWEEAEEGGIEKKMTGPASRSSRIRSPDLQDYGRGVLTFLKKNALHQAKRNTREGLFQ